MRYGASSLYHNDGKGRFSDVTRAAGLPPYPFLPGAAAFVDVDHDGDLDLVDRRPRRPRGDATRRPRPQPGFPLSSRRRRCSCCATTATAPSPISPARPARGTRPCGGDRADRLRQPTRHRPAHRLRRRGRRRSWPTSGTARSANVADDVGLGAAVRTGAAFTAATAGDVNKDDWPDFFLALDRRWRPGVERRPWPVHGDAGTGGRPGGARGTGARLRQRWLARSRRLVGRMRPASSGTSGANGAT